MPNFEIIKLLSAVEVFLRMNLHEQCLLRYLTHPDELSYATEILKLNNKILEKKFIIKNILANAAKLNYTENVD